MTRKPQGHDEMTKLLGKLVQVPKKELIGGAASVTYWTEKRWMLSVADPPGPFLFILWPLFLVLVIGWAFGRWLASNKPIPLPPEVEEKR